MGSEFFRSWISSTMCTSPANTTDLCTIPLSEDETGEIWVVETKPKQRLKTKVTVPEGRKLNRRLHLREKRCVLASEITISCSY